MLTQLRARLTTILRRLLTEERIVRGVPVRVVNTRGDIESDAVFGRIDAALSLIERYDPRRFRRFQRDTSVLTVSRYPCRGAYLSQSRTCIVELTFAVNPAFTPGQIAATIVHEGMHARLYAMRVAKGGDRAAREERICREAEIAFGRAIPDGAAVIYRAETTVALPDEEIAFKVDWQEAHRRVVQADIDALDLPKWLKRWIARRRGVGDGRAA